MYLQSIFSNIIDWFHRYILSRYCERGNNANKSEEICKWRLIQKQIVCKHGYA